MNPATYNEEFWERAHFAHERYWLGCSPADAVLRWHELARPVGKRVMNIGVGEGDFEKNLSMDNTVVSVDVCDAALQKAKKMGASEVWPTSELAKIEPVDLAVCNLVCQHVPDDTVRFIVDNVRLREPYGLMSIQFANASPISSAMGRHVKDGLMFFRDTDRIHDLIDGTSKMISAFLKGPDFTEKKTSIQWYILRLIPKGGRNS